MNKFQNPKHPGSLLGGMSIRRKLIAMTMAVSAAALIVSGVMIVYFQMSSYRENLIDKLSADATILATNSKGAIDFDDAEDASSVLETLKARPSIAYACITKSDKSVLASYRREGFLVNPEIAPELGAHRLDEKWLVVQEPVIVRGENIGSVFIQSDLIEMYDFRNLIINTISIVSVVVLLAAFVLSSWLQKLISGPIEHLTNVANSVSETRDYSLRATPASNDEVGLLTGAFNDMLSEIERRNAELQQKDFVIRSSSTVIATASMAGILTYVNPACLAAWGFDSPDEMIGRPFPEFWMVDDRMHELMTALMGSGKKWGGEIKGKKKDGSLFDVQVSAATVLDGKGEPIALMSTSIDITERKQAEEALRESEEKFRSLIESSCDWIWEVTSEGVYTYSSPQVESILGYSPDELIGSKTPFDLVVPEDAERIANIFADLAKEGQSIVALENINLHKDGRFVVLETSGIPVFDQVGKVTGFRGIDRDITERKLAEVALQKAQDYISNIIDSMPSVLVGVDADGKVTQWNSEAQQATGVSPKDAVGQTLEDVFPHLADEMDRVREAMKKREVSSDPRRVSMQDGQKRYEDVTVFPLVANGVEGAVIRVDDVTDRVQIEEMMVQSEKMLSVGGLAAGMAHEINNPLAGMMQTASVVDDRLTNLELPANIKAASEAGISMEAIGSFMASRGIVKMLKNIKESGRRAADIVNNMLSFSRKSNSGFSSCNLVELLDQTVDLAGSDYDLKKKYDFRQIEIVREYQEGVPYVPCESSKIQQVLLNLLRNGAEAMQEARDSDPERKPCFTLGLKHEQDTNMLAIEILDNGLGMDEETRKRAFEPFFTTKPTDRGTGLGLSVSYFIITENHKGLMSVESTLGEGTAFTIKLPLKRGL